MISKDELKEIYNRNVSSYEKVCIAGKNLVESVLREKKIDLLHVSSRVKSFESFFEKITRKKYQDPYNEIEDICGIRVVCFYSNDLERINNAIKEAFLLNDFIDKIENQEADRFGYRSNHYIVGLPKEDKYAKLDGIKIEVQARTILMHAWAHIQGKLEYKKAEHIPRNFRRKLYQLSAILELADSQFQSLKTEKDSLRELLSTGNSRFSASTELNIDTFMSFMDVFFPGRLKSYRYSKLLMKELLKLQIDFGQIIECYDRSSSCLFDFEQDVGFSLTQEEALKIVLCLGNSSIFSNLKDDPFISGHIKAIQKWIVILEE